MGVITLTGSIFSDGLLLVALLTAGWYVHSWQRLRHVPGPALWGWSVFPLFRLHQGGYIYDKFGELSDKYGPLVRIAPNTLLAADPEVLRRMSATRSPYTRAKWFISLRMNPGQDNVISTRDERLHDELRRRMAHGYSGKENKSLESDIDGCVQDLVNLVGRKYLSTPEQVVPMDLARKMQFFTLDVISKLSMDAKFNDLRDDTDNYGYISEIETLFTNIFCTCTIPSVIEFLTNVGILGLLAPTDENTFGLGRILRVTREQISKRFSVDGKLVVDKNDMIGSFIRNGMTQAEVVRESVMQLAAGSDTTASGVRGTMLCIITHPPVYARLMAEIDAALAEGKIPSDENEVISDAQAREMPYLQACIKEGLRWYPPIAGLLAKEVPPGGDTLNGYFVPGGTSIGYSAKAIHHSPYLFGPDEYSYRPSRWIHTSQGGDEPSLDKIKAMERNNELIFGYGKYQCLGKNVAMIELNKVFVELLRRYEFTLMNQLHQWDTVCYGIHFQKHMWVTVRRREKLET